MFGCGAAGCVGRAAHRQNEERARTDRAPIYLSLRVRYVVFRSVRTELFDELVVHAQKKERCDPLADKTRFFLIPAELEHERRRYRPSGRPKEKVGRQLRRLFLDGFRDRALGMLLSFSAGAAGVECRI